MRETRRAGAGRRRDWLTYLASPTEITAHSRSEACSVVAGLLPLRNPMTQQRRAAAAGMRQSAR